MLVATLGSKPAKPLKDALLPVLGFCTKNKDPSSPYYGALCITTNGDDVEFWTANGYSFFISKCLPGTLDADLNACIQQSKFGLLIEHIKKAKQQLDIEIHRNDVVGTVELAVTSENGLITVSDSLEKSPPDIGPYREKSPTAETATTMQQFSPRVCLPVLDAFKGAEEKLEMEIELTGSEGPRLRVRTTANEPVCRFEALIMGLTPPRK